MSNINFPTKIEECYNDPNLIKTLIDKIHNNQLSNMIFYGDSSTCKTTLVKMILQERKKYFNITNEYHLYYNYILENIMTITTNNNLIPSNIKINSINKNDNKKIKIDDIINDYIKYPTENKNINKIIVIDDFDSIPTNNQQNIINLIDYYNDVIFIIICNNIDKLENTFKSRLSLYYLKHFTYEEHIKYLTDIMKIDCNKINKNVLKQIYITTNGNIKMSMYYYNILLSKSNEITYDMFINTFNVLNIIIIKQFLKYILQYKKFDKVIIDSIKLFDDNNYSCINTMECMWFLLENINISKYKLNDYQQKKIMYILSKSIVNMCNTFESWVYFNITIQKIIKYLNINE